MFLRQHSIISGLHQKRHNTKRSFSLNTISVCLLHKTEETQQEVDSCSKINFKSHFSKKSFFLVTFMLWPLTTNFIFCKTATIKCWN